MLRLLGVLHGSGPSALPIQPPHKNGLGFRSYPGNRKKKTKTVEMSWFDGFLKLSMMYAGL